jgi:protein-S-isoprenylcysteine O-methyltransferase Ste14
MDLVRIPVQLAVAWSMHGALTPPNPPAAEDTQVTTNAVEAFFKKTLRVIPVIAKVSFNLLLLLIKYLYMFQIVLWVQTAGDISFVLLSRDLIPHMWKASFAELLTGHSTSFGISAAATPAFLAGAALSVFGCRIRSAAYAALGRHFTFELAVRKDQKLVTSYPYNIVRHPSYLGGFVGALGANIAIFGARGGWVREALVPWTTSASPFAQKIVTSGIWVFTILQGILVVGLSARVSSEDRMMKRHFGKEWEDWARRVPYKLIPGVY